MEQASLENDSLKLYIEQFIKNKNYNKAILFTKTHELVMLLIQNKVEEGAKNSLEFIKNAIELKDTFLIINFKFYYSNFLMSQKKLDEYIQNCLDIIDLENKLVVKTSYYGSVIDNLLDAYIFKGNYDASATYNTTGVIGASEWSVQLSKNNQSIKANTILM